MTWQDADTYRREIIELGYTDPTRLSLPDDVTAKLDRAGELIRQIETWRTTIPEMAAEARPLGSKQWAAHLTTEPINVPPWIPVVAGECVFHIRGVLDYTIVRLLPESKQAAHETSTQFPICKSQAEWDNVTNKRWFSDVPPEAQELLRSMQPMPGAAGRVAWLSTLQQLSNIDKHRRLIVAPIITRMIGMSAGPATTIDNSARLARGQIELEAQIMTFEVDQIVSANDFNIVVGGDIGFCEWGHVEHLNMVEELNKWLHVVRSELAPSLCGLLDWLKNA